MQCNDSLSLYCTVALESVLGSQEQVDSKCIPAPHFCIINVDTKYLKFGDNFCSSWTIFLFMTSVQSLTLPCPYLESPITRCISE